MAIRSGGSAFHWPAMQASTSLMVPEKHLARIAGLNQTFQGAMSIVSPPLGALLVMALPMQGVLAIDVVTALLAVLPLLFIALPQPARQVRSATEAAAGEKPSMWQDMLEGFRYVRAWPGLLAVILMAVVLNLIFTPVSTLTPLLGTGHFGGGAAELGWIESAFGLGMLGGGLLLSVWGGFKRKIVTSLAALLLLGVGVMLVGFAPAHLLWVAIAGMFIIGFTNPIVNGPLMAIVQAHVAPDMQGRVFSLLGSACIAAAPIGLLVIGPLADAIGVPSPQSRSPASSPSSWA
jgi:DHA3 family macrolide efflux protein-like MFS transporter